MLMLLSLCACADEKIKDLFPNSGEPPSLSETVQDRMIWEYDELNNAKIKFSEIGYIEDTVHLRLENSADISIHAIYSPLNPIDHPSYATETPVNTGKADLWLCYKEEKFCHAAGYHHTDPVQYHDRPGTFVLSGFGGYKIEICLQKINSGKSLFNPQIEFNDKTFSITVRTPALLIDKFVDPVMSTNPTQLTQFNHSETENVFYEESSNKEYIEYAITQFKPITGMYIVLGHQVLYNATFFADFSSQLSCPYSYTCPYAQQATVWKCWTTFLKDEKVCESVADISYGFKLKTVGFEIFGGQGETSFTVNAACDANIPDNELKLSSPTLVGQKQNVFKASSSAFCMKKMLNQKAPPKILTGGAIAIVAFWSSIIIFIGTGVIWNYLSQGSVLLPFSKLFGKIGYSIIVGWNTLTCSKEEKPTKKNKELEFESSAQMYSVL